MEWDGVEEMISNTAIVFVVLFWLFGSVASLFINGWSGVLVWLVISVLLLFILWGKKKGEFD